MLPNFIIIGAMKSGTTSLAKYLSEHPDIFISNPKEPGFFNEQINWNKGFEWYEKLFNNASNCKAIGEASTHYTKLPIYSGVVEKLKIYLPHIKLIYIMRDPIDRAISHYWHMVHYHHETRPINKAITIDSPYVWYSRYKYQMQPYLRTFSTDQILFLLYDDLVNCPEKVIKKCFEFLEVDPNVKPQSLGKVFNPRPPKISKTKNLFLYRIRHSKTWEKISPFFPKFFKKQALRLESQEIDPSENLSLNKVEELKKFFSEDIYFMINVSEKFS